LKVRSTTNPIEKRQTKGKLKTPFWKGGALSKGWGKNVQLKPQGPWMRKKTSTKAGFGVIGRKEWVVEQRKRARDTRPKVELQNERLSLGSESQRGGPSIPKKKAKTTEWFITLEGGSLSFPRGQGPSYDRKNAPQQASGKVREWRRPTGK